MQRLLLCLALACALLWAAACGNPPGDTNQNDAATTPICGNDTREIGEFCDGADLRGETCQTQGWGGGTLSCSATCLFDFAGCTTPPTCGDSQLQAPEQCDGAALNSQTCQVQGFDGGNLTCDASCLFNTSACYRCGDGTINGNEDCEGTDLGTATCQTQGFDGGTLACDPSCAFVTSSCYRCGDSTKNGAEECDGNDFGTSTYANVAGHASGSLSCSGTCTVVATDCYTCGDGALDGPEVCDGTNLDSETCGTQTATLNEGSLACAADCLAYDASDCHLCGNGTTEGPEACDDGDFQDDDFCSSDCMTLCPAGTISPHNGHCYRRTTPPSTWLDARIACVVFDGYIATIADASENEFVATNFGFGIWIGYNDLAVEGVFVWDSGEAVTFENWATDQPDNDFGIQHCVRMNGIGEWFDHACNGEIGPLLFAVCEIDGP